MIFGVVAGGDGAGETFVLKSSDSDRTRFTVRCALDQHGVCDAVNPGKNGSAWHAGNGTLDLKTGAATLRLDNLVTRVGRFDTSGYGKVVWLDDNTTWHRLPRCMARCKVAQDPNCDVMNIHGPTINDVIATELITGKPWIVFIHGGEFKYYSVRAMALAAVIAAVPPH
eukprot:SAG22_NODE_741_length_7507_cov_2.893224_4_plen_169_part_00